MYHNHSTFLTHLHSLTSDPYLSPYLSLHSHAVTTPHNNTLHLVRLTSPTLPLIPQSAVPPPRQHAQSPSSKLLLLLSFGEHPRELITVESFFDLVHNLTAPFTLQPPSFPLTSTPPPPPPGCLSYAHQLSSFLLSHIDLHLLPLLNPDGKRLLETLPAPCQRHNARRVDLNRNSAWAFLGPGASPVPGHEEYAGTAAFSEVETALVRDLLTANAYAGYVSVHSGERQFFSGFVDTESRRTKRVPKERPGEEGDVGWVGERVLRSTAGWFRDWGVGWERNSYSADGTLFDWAAGSAGVKYVYCVELWGGLLERAVETDDCFMQFNPPPERLQADLERARGFFIQLMLAVIERERGVTFRYTEWSARSEEAQQEMLRLCAVEQSAHRLYAALQPS